MGRKRRWHSVRRDGPGRMRIKIAALLLRDCGLIADPYDINTNNSPPDRYLDSARWDVDAKKEGFPFFYHVCSWDRMTDIIKAGGIAVVEDNYLHFEVCRGKPPATA